MPEAKTVSIHKSTTGGVSEFLEDETFECLNSMKLLSYLSGALLRYEEEGVALNPQVVLCGSVDSLTRSFPGGKHYLIGSSSFSTDLGKRILKDCASVAQNGWVIYIERVSDIKFNYGVISYLASPTSLSLKDMIGIDASSFTVLIERTDSSTVRLIGSKGNSLDVAFSTVRESTKNDADIAKFAGTCVDAASAESTIRYMERLIGRLLDGSHGSILVCCDGAILEVPGMADAVLLSPPINILAAFENYRTIDTADALLELQRTESLLAGLMQSDGIVAFNGSGQVTAYRVFYRPPAVAT